MMTRTWLLILGVSGLIILFWFVKDAIALRYFVSVKDGLCRVNLSVLSGSLYWCNVMHVRIVGCSW
jgi:hypothetical protein